MLHEGSIYSIEGNNVQVRSLQGTVKQTLNFSESEGQPIGLDVCGNFLVASTINGIVKLWDLSRRYGTVSTVTNTFPCILLDIEIISVHIDEHNGLLFLIFI